MTEVTLGSEDAVDACADEERVFMEVVAAGALGDILLIELRLAVEAADLDGVGGVVCDDITVAVDGSVDGNLAALGVYTPGFFG